MVGSSRTIEAPPVQLQLSLGGIQALFNEMHGSGFMRHNFATVDGDNLFELALGCPAVSEVTAAPAGARGRDGPRVIARMSIAGNSRSVARADDLGVSFVAMVQIKATFEQPSAKSGVETDAGRVVVDWSETAPEDIQILSGPAGDDSIRIRDFLHAVLASLGGGTFDVAAGVPGLGGEAATNIRARALAGGSGLAFEMGAVTRTDGRSYVDPVGGQDWAVATTARHVGPLIARLAGRKANAILRKGGNSATSDTSRLARLTGVEAVLEDGLISAKGVVETIDVGVGQGRLSGPFETSVMNLNDAPDSTAQVRGRLLALRSLLGDATSRSIQEVFAAAGSAVVDHLGPNSLWDVVKVPFLRQADVETSDARLEVRRSGVVLGGNFINSSVAQEPLALFTFFAGSTNSSSIIFNASQAWTPGSTTMSYSWDFGDGSPILTTTGSARVMVSKHVFPGAGVYAVSLQVTSEDGRSASNALDVQVGQVTAVVDSVRNPGGPDNVVLSGASEDPSVVISITSNGTPLAGLRCSVRVGSEWVTGHTDRLGRLFIAVPIGASEPDDLAGPEWLREAVHISLQEPYAFEQEAWIVHQGLFEQWIFERWHRVPDVIERLEDEAAGLPGAELPDGSTKTTAPASLLKVRQLFELTPEALVDAAVLKTQGRETPSILDWFLDPIPFG